mgnify:CR=1 FL=1
METPMNPVNEAATADVPPAWRGERGRINGEMVKKYFSDFANGDFLMCGPDGFMDGVKAMLEAEGVEVKGHLRKESFG